MKVLHVITGLNRGGAEAMLVKLLAGMDRNRFDQVVVSLMPEGGNRPDIEAMGIPVHDLGMERGLPGPVALFRMAKLARRLAPDLVQGWMYHGNLAAHYMRRFHEAPEVWNVRHSVHDLGHEKPLTGSIIKLGARLSGRPRRIVFNSEVSRDQHVALGYRRANSEVIPNGFDLERFRPDPAARARIRAELGLDPTTPLVGLVGRRHPHKGHADFLAAVARVHAVRPGAAYLMAGRGVTAEALGLAGHPAADRLFPLGERPDAPHLMAALDVLCVSSVTEAFPNVLGEAMACGVPCVTTDVGDAARIVEGLGRIVPAGNPEALADALEGMLDLPEEARRDLGARGRERIAERYSLAAVVGRYEDLYESLA